MAVINYLPMWFVLTYVALVGACFGSFINVVVARLPAGESLIRPRSRCPSCKASIAWYDNLPVISWLILRGRCRGCGGVIAVRYLLVEALTSALMVALYLQLGVSLQFLFWAVLFLIFIAIVYLDIDHFWIPDVLSVPAMLWGATGAFFPGGIGITAALYGLLPAVFLFLFAKAFSLILKREGMGFGDIKLLMVLGLAQGVLPTIILLLIASVQGSIIGIAIIAAGGHKPKVPASDGFVPHPRAVPFGPFLVLACFEMVLMPKYFLDLPLSLLNLGGSWF